MRLVIVVLAALLSFGQRCGGVETPKIIVRPAEGCPLPEWQPIEIGGEELCIKDETIEPSPTLPPTVTTTTTTTTIPPQTPTPTPPTTLTPTPEPTSTPTPAPESTPCVVNETEYVEVDAGKRYKSVREFAQDEFDNWDQSMGTRLPNGGVAPLPGTEQFCAQSPTSSRCVWHEFNPPNTHFYIAVNAAEARFLGKKIAGRYTGIEITAGPRYEQRPWLSEPPGFTRLATLRGLGISGYFETRAQPCPTPTPTPPLPGTCYEGPWHWTCDDSRCDLQKEPPSSTARWAGDLELIIGNDLGRVIQEDNVPVWMNILKGRATVMGFPCAESRDDIGRRIPWDEISLSIDGTRKEFWDFCASVGDARCELGVVLYGALLVSP